MPPCRRTLLASVSRTLAGPKTYLAGNLLCRSRTVSSGRSRTSGLWLRSVMNKTVLVTGGAGYVGAHGCKALAAAGYQPVVFDNLAYGHEQAVRWGPLERGDIA